MNEEAMQKWPRDVLENAIRNWVAALDGGRLPPHVQARILSLIERATGEIRRRERLFGPRDPEATGS